MIHLILLSKRLQLAFHPFHLLNLMLVVLVLICQFSQLLILLL
jgi:hypothetical protein